MSYYGGRSSYGGSSYGGGGGYGGSRGYGGGGYGGRGRSNNDPGSSLRTPDWSSIQLPHFQKDFYQEHPNVARKTPQEIEAFRREQQMTIVGDVYRPVSTFEEANFPEYIMQTIREAGFEKPTPIQCQGWPMAMSGRDMIGIAQTGSGKTLAFILPAIVHINAQPLLRPGDGPIVLVVAPTRELAA